MNQGFLLSTTVPSSAACDAPASGLSLSATTLLVADGSCPWIRELLEGAEAPVLWLTDDDPLGAVTETLAVRRQLGQPVQTLHWVSHGRPGVRCAFSLRSLPRQFVSDLRPQGSP